LSNSMAFTEYERLLEEQIRTASGARLEWLSKQDEGERKLMVDVVWPVRKTFKGIVLEKEVVTLTGVLAYIDVFDENFRLGLEAEGFVVHAQNATRSRFDFERNKVRSMVAQGIHYLPFSYDEMDKRPDVCRRALYEIYGRYGSYAGVGEQAKPNLYEREIIRYALWLNRPFGMKDVEDCLLKSPDICRKAIRSLVRAGLVKPNRDNLKRNHFYVLEPAASKSLWFASGNLSDKPDATMKKT